MKSFKRTSALFVAAACCSSLLAGNAVASSFKDPERKTYLAFELGYSIFFTFINRTKNS